MDFSRIRQQINELRDEQDRLLPMLMRPKKMARDSITWQGKREDCVGGRKPHANLVRNVDGKSETKRVRDAHVGWLTELLAERSAHALRLRRWREIDKHIEALLTDMKRVVSNMLDFDACAITGSKKCDVKMYTGERGTMSYLAFIDNICLMAELESGNHSPADSIDKRATSCFEICRRQGVPILQFRSDSAAYVGEVMNESSRRSITFYIRADNDVAVKRAYGTVGKWHKPKTDKGETEAYELGTTVHCMDTTDEAFTLVAKRELVDKDPSEKSGQCEFEGLENTDYRYFSVATNELVDEDRQDAATAEMIVATYNKRGNMENRIKQLVSDAQAGRLPTSDLDANRIYFYVMACLHNLMELFKYKCLSLNCQKLRLPTLIRTVLRVPAVVVFHARHLYLRLPVYKKDIACAYEEVLKKISALNTMFSKNEKPLLFAEIIFRRD